MRVRFAVGRFSLHSKFVIICGRRKAHSARPFIATRCSETKCNPNAVQLRSLHELRSGSARNGLGVLTTKNGTRSHLHVFGRANANAAPVQIRCTMYERARAHAIIHQTFFHHFMEKQLRTLTIRWRKRAKCSQNRKIE